MHVPLRTCVACRRTTRKAELTRLVVVSDNVRVDPSGKRPGRGAYLCGRAVCIDAALRRDGAVIRRALRVQGQPVQLDGGSLRKEATNENEEATKINSIERSQARRGRDIERSDRARRQGVSA